MTDELKRHIVSFLSQQTHMALAVESVNEGPWVVPVRIKKWQGSFIEWDSKIDTLHSLSIKKKPNISLCMFLPGKEDGFYAVAQARRLYKLHGDYWRYQAEIKKAWHNGEEYIKREIDLSLLKEITYEKDEIK